MILTDEMKKRCYHRENYKDGTGTCSICDKNCIGKESCLCKNNQFCESGTFRTYSQNNGICKNVTDMKLKLFRPEAFDGIDKYEVEQYSKLHDFLEFWIKQWRTTPEGFGKAVLPSGWKLIENKEKERLVFEAFKKENPGWCTYCSHPFFEFVKEPEISETKEHFDDKSENTYFGLPVISWDVEENSCCQNNKNGISW